MHALLLLLLLSTKDAATPLDAYRALQIAAKAKDIDAMSMLLTPEEREELAGLDAAAAAQRVPAGALTIKSESDETAAGEADGRPLVFFRLGQRWLIAGVFAKAPVAMLETLTPVRADKAEIVTVAPIRGAGLPDANAITAAKAYELLRAAALHARSEVHLYTLDTGMHGLSATGASSGWVAEFLTGTEGEMLTVTYENGAVEPPVESFAPPNRPALPDEAHLGFDLEPLYEQTVGYARGIVDPITLVTASLYRSARTGGALWLLDVYGGDDSIGQTVVFDGHTMKYSHKTN